MLNETPAELVRHLSHPNGWWRHTAQRLLVLKQDKTVAPALRTIVRSSDNLLARFHALWTLEGLGELDATLVREQMEDPNPRMRVQAIRASETLYKAGDKSLETNYRTAMKDADVDVALQGILTLNVLKVPGAMAAIRPVVESAKARGIKEIGGQLITRATPSFAAAGGAGGRGGRGGPSFAPAEVESLTRGMGIYNELCFSCHGEDGRGAPLAGAPPGTTRAPSLEASARVNGHRDYVIKVLLHGLTGPLDGQTYTEVMIPMGSNSDQWVADVASFVRNSFSNNSAVVTAADVARVRAATASRKTSWTLTELLPTVPVLMESSPAWKVTASHASENAPRALTGQQQGWSSGVPQQQGMWFQVELPEAVQVAEVQIDAAAPGFGRGGGGRGAAAAAPGAPPAPGFPQGYQLQVSMDGNRWTSVAQGQGSGASIVIPIQPVRAKFVRITQTATPAADAPAWSVQRIRVFRLPGR
jgi:mono/diheme cytochrome c family protein